MPRAVSISAVIRTSRPIASTTRSMSAGDSTFGTRIPKSPPTPAQGREVVVVARVHPHLDAAVRRRRRVRRSQSATCVACDRLSGPARPASSRSRMTSCAPRGDRLVEPLRPVARHVQRRDDRSSESTPCPSPDPPRRVVLSSAARVSRRSCARLGLGGRRSRRRCSRARGARRRCRRRAAGRPSGSSRASRTGGTARSASSSGRARRRRPSRPCRAPRTAGRRARRARRTPARRRPGPSRTRSTTSAVGRARDPRRHRVVELVGVLGPRVTGGEPRLVDEVRSADEAHHPLGDRLRAVRHRDPLAVAGAVDVARRVVHRPVAGPRLHDARAGRTR